MKDTTYIRVIMNNPAPSKIPVDHIAVSCDYSKGKGIVISAYPAESREGSWALLITNGKYKLVEPMTRLNRKRLEEVKAKVEDQLDGHDGAAWDLVLAICNERDLMVA